MSNIKAMRAYKLADDQISSIAYPCYAQPKFDGIRAIVYDNIPFSNTLKPIRNQCIRYALANLNGADGELISGSNFQETTSVVMSEMGGSDFIYYVFDSFVRKDKPFLERIKDLEEIISSVHDPRIKIVYPVKIKSPQALLDYETHCLQLGHEGCMVRSASGIYKFGRSTLREQYLLKRKPVVDEEAFIIGFEEQEENLNELNYDNRGYAQRSAHQANKRGKNTLGAFIVRSAKWGDFRIGTGLGLTDSLRQEIWNNRDKYLGQTLTFKYQEYGSKDKPRQPIFLRFRHKDDVLIEL